MSDFLFATKTARREVLVSKSNMGSASFVSILYKYGFCSLGNDGTKTSRRSPLISSLESGCPMEVWLAPGVAFVLGWTLRPLVETKEVKLTPCNCQCVCECISKEQSSGLQVTLLFLVIGLGIVTGILILRQRETASVTLDSPSKGKKGFAGTKGQVLTLTS